MKGGAYFDSTEVYRYSLWRCWDAASPRLLFIMLNPSTADAQINDPTIRCCIQFAQAWGYGSLEVVNLFAFRTPYPQKLREVANPVGIACDRHILAAAGQADRIVAAWGNWGRLYNRDQAVLQLLSSSEIYCLGCNQSGQPRHPLYLKRTLQPLLYSKHPLRLNHDAGFGELQPG